MNAASLTVKPFHQPCWRVALADPLLLLGIIVGFAPVLAGLAFRTYGFHVSPNSVEVLRQLDVPFILVELAVIIWARANGLRFRQTVGYFDLPAKFALALFLSTFWISSAFISRDAGYSMLRASFSLVHIGFGFSVFHLAGAPTQKGALRFGTALVAGFVVFLPLMATHLLSAPDPATIPEGRIIWSSAIPGCLSVRHLGIWAALVLAGTIGALFVCDEDPRGRSVVCLIILVTTAVLFWSGTRAGAYGVFGASCFLLAVVRKAPSPRSVSLAVFAAVAGIFLSQFWLPPDTAFGLLRRADTLPGSDPEAFATGRTVLWASMLQAFMGSPLFGVGEGAVHWFVTLSGDRHVQPHNAIVQMLSSWGVIACTAFGYLLARMLLALHRAARSDVSVLPFVLLINCLLIISLADGALYFSRFIMWFAAASAVALRLTSSGSTHARSD